MKKSSFSFTALGIIIGTGLGILVSLLIDINIYWFLIGTSIGLIIGAIVDGHKKP